MFSLLKKDILVLIRNKSELITLFLMPFILIGILGFALQGLLGGNYSDLHMSVALVKEDEKEEGLEKFIGDLHEKGFPIEQITSIQMGVTELNPVHLLEEIFAQDQLKEMVEIKEMTASAAEEAVNHDEVVAIIRIPEQFTYDTLQNAILGVGDGSSLELVSSGASPFYSNILTSILDGFVQTYNYETAIATAVSGEVLIEDTFVTGLGGFETLTKMEPVNSFQYYTFGMSVMFVLYVAGNIASGAYLEKRQNTFDRIILSDQRPSAYLIGKGISATVIAFLQLMILFLLASLVFSDFGKLEWSFWLGLALISFVLALSVGCIGILLTSLSVRYNSEAISGIFTGGVVTLFAFVGGSFIPLENMPELVTKLGSWTPNGAAFSAYLNLIQGYDFSSFVQPFLKIMTTSVILFAVGLLIFPKGRSV